jgi:hypothetical protein
MNVTQEELKVAIELKRAGVEWHPAKRDSFAHHVHLPEYGHLSYFNVGEVHEDGKIPDSDEFCVYDEDTWLPSSEQVEKLLAAHDRKVVNVSAECDSGHRVTLDDGRSFAGSTRQEAFYRALLDVVEENE